MSCNDETIPDIVTEMCKCAEENPRLKIVPRMTIQTWLNLASRLKAAYKREIDAARPFVRDANRYYHGGVMIVFTDETAEQLIHNQDAAQEWLNNHPQEEKNDGPR